MSAVRKRTILVSTPVLVSRDQPAESVAEHMLVR